MEAGRSDLNEILQIRGIPAAEPVFLLRGQDPAAPAAVRAWAVEAFEAGVPFAVLEQALQQADRMAAWGVKKVPGDDHLTRDQAQQLGYEFGRRAWRAEPPQSAELLLAFKRGLDQGEADRRKLSQAADAAMAAFQGLKAQLLKLIGGRRG